MKLGITMIEMYCRMVRDQFAPMLLKLGNHEKFLKEEMEVEAKKELGIYELYLEKAKLELAVQEIERKLKGYETATWHDGNIFKSPIDLLVEGKMQDSKNGLRKEVEATMQDLIWKIKLTGVSDDTKQVFEALPKTIERLTEKLSKLPAPVPKKMLK